MKKIEAFLYTQGFTHAPLRRVMLAQMLLMAASLVVGLALAWKTRWVLQFCLGASLVGVNFWFLSKFMFRNMRGGYSRSFLVGHLLGFSGRLMLTAAALGAVIIYGGSPAALVAGLSSCMAVVCITMLMQRFSGS